MKALWDVFVCNIPESSSEKALRELFERRGGPVQRLVYNSKTKSATLEFFRRNDAETIINGTTIQPFVLDGVRLEVKRHYSNSAVKKASSYNPFKGSQPASPVGRVAAADDDADVWFAPPAAKKVAVEATGDVWIGGASVRKEQDTPKQHREEHRERSRFYDRKRDSERGRSQSRHSERSEYRSQSRGPERDRRSREPESRERERDRERESRDRDRERESRYREQERREPVRYGSVPPVPSQHNVISNTDGLTPRTLVPDVVMVPSSNRKSKYKLTPEQKKELFQQQVMKAQAAKEQEEKERQEKERLESLERAQREELQKQLAAQANALKLVQQLPVVIRAAPSNLLASDEQQRLIQQQQQQQQQQLQAQLEAQLQLQLQQQQQPHRQLQQYEQRQNQKQQPDLKDNDDDVWINPVDPRIKHTPSVIPDHRAAPGKVVDAIAAELIAEAELDEGIWFQEPSNPSNLPRVEIEPEMADENEWVDAWDSNAWEWDEGTNEPQQRVEVGVENEDGVWTWTWREPTEADSRVTARVPVDNVIVKREAEDGKESNDDDLSKRIKLEPPDVATFLPAPSQTPVDSRQGLAEVAVQPVVAAVAASVEESAPKPVAPVSVPSPKPLKSALAAPFRAQVAQAEWNHAGAEYTVIPTAFGLIEMMKSFPSDLEAPTKAQTPSSAPKGNKMNWLELVVNLLKGRGAKDGISAVSLGQALGKNPRVSSRPRWKAELKAFLEEAVKREKLVKVNRTYFLPKK
jgi:hypothetical protein